MKKFIDTLLLIMIILTGLSLFLYPTVSNYMSEQNGSRAIEDYAENVSGLDQAASAEELAKAERYNEALYRSSIDAEPTSVSQSDYDYMLNLSGDGMIGYVDIPRINVRLPIYHGTDGKTLESYIGHMPSSSLPVGGKGTHTVLSGHRGLPSARLFTDLDELEKGDIFFLMILDETLSYEVDQIRIVLPTELSDLEIDEEKDLCTLVTCTPYGINTHRLLVRGHRVENPEEQPVVRVSADAFMIDPVLVAPLAAVPLILLLLLLLLISSRKGTLHGRALRKAREEQRELEAAYEERNE